ncbi:MAG: histidine kinase [Nitrospirae bacterium]|nr:histidine kinase [Nitrospirota bacterium]
MNDVIGSASSLLLDTFDSIHIPVFIIDNKENVISCNHTACTVLQYSAHDIAGQHIRLFITPFNNTDSSIHPDTFSPPPAAFPAGQKDTGQYESPCKRKDGTSFIAHVSILPCHNDEHRLVVMQDVSGQKKLQQKTSRKTKELAIFNTFAKILTTHTDTDRITQETVTILADIMEADKSWIYLINDDNGELCLKGWYGFDDHDIRQGELLNPGKSFDGEVISSGRPLLVENASGDPGVSRRDKDIRSIAGVPISSRGVIMGSLGIASRKASFFTAKDIQLLTTIGSQLGVAIENSRLIKQLQNKMEQIELINELSSLINSSLSIGTIFRMMVSEIRKIVDYNRASLLLYNEKDQNLTIFALDTDMKTVMKKGVRAPIEGTSSGWVLKNNRPWINYDLREAAFSLDRKLLQEGIRSTISIPLFYDRPLGVFNLDSTESSTYSEKDLNILVPVAKHISIALVNALLFEQISKEKKEWEKTFDAITDMVWIEDGKRRILRANATLLSKTGFSSGEITGKICWELLDKIGIHQTKCLCAATLRTKQPSFGELKGAGRSIFHFWAYPLIDEEGQLYSIVHYLKDVTSQKQLEQKLIRSEKLASLGTLVAGIAHEINNPLGIIAGYSEALLDRSKEQSLLENKEFDDFPEYLETIHNEIFRCKGILKSLLDFARPSGGTFRYLDINELIKEVILLVNHRAKRLKHNIELKLNRDLPKIYADPGSLRQLFMNIIINSMYFTPSGGSIVITTEMDTPEQDTDIIRVSVSDTGTGISSESLDKIFDPFFTTKPVGEGTGLGLSICHKIVEAHKGTIDVESEAGRGTTFTIRFPAKEQNG